MSRQEEIKQEDLTSEDLASEDEQLDRNAVLDELFNEEEKEKLHKKEEKRIQKQQEKALKKAEKKKKKQRSDDENPEEAEEVSESEAIEQEASEEAEAEAHDESEAEELVENPEEADDTKSRKRKKKDKPADEINIVKDLISLCFYILFVVFLCWFVLTFIGQRTEVSGDSMNNTLHNGDSLWIDKVSYDFSDPERFDIVVFPYDNTDTYYIKRIIGLPGETVYIDEEGVVYINDEPLEDDIYGKEAIDPTKRGVASEPITLGDDEYFVMGDNRNNSRDSRVADVGNIAKDDLIGKAVFRFTGGFGKIE
jgi:signal peptidase I